MRLWHHMAALVPHGTHEGLVTIPQELLNGKPWRRLGGNTKPQVSSCRNRCNMCTVLWLIYICIYLRTSQIS